MPDDIELGGPSSTPKPTGQIGYRLWASRIASDQDHEPFVFRKFDDLGALNLLYLQAEMLSLESQLGDLDVDLAHHLDIRSVDAARDWDIFKKDSSRAAAVDSTSESPTTPSVALSRKRMEVVLELRSKIKEYYEALLLQNQVIKLRKPSKRVLQGTQHMFLQDGYPAIDGHAREYLHAADLVALKYSTQDPLSNYLRKSRITRIKDPDSIATAPGLARFDEDRVTRYVNLITILVATVFLAGPILALYFCSSAPARLSIIVLFTAGFAASVSFITNARRAEIFLGSATYAAVLVVFISNGDLTGGE